MHHFTTLEAKTQLLKEAQECLTPAKRFKILEFLYKWENTVLLFFGLTAILDFIFSSILVLKKWIDYGALAEGVLIVVGLCWNWYLFSW